MVCVTGYVILWSIAAAGPTGTMVKVGLWDSGKFKICSQTNNQKSSYFSEFDRSIPCMLYANVYYYLRF